MAAMAVLTSAPPDRSARGQVSEVQRARLLAAAAEIVAEQGYRGLTVARVIRRAGVSRRTFYDAFAGREDCFVALFDQALVGIEAVVVPAYLGQERWREGIRAGLTALLVLLDSRTSLKTLVITDALGVGHTALEHRARGLAQIIEVVDRGRQEMPHGRRPPPLTAEGVAGAVFAVLHARTIEDSARPLLPLLPQLMGMIVLPYLGPAAAARELSRPAPRRPRHRRAPAAATPRRSSANPLEGLHMRLTYRTLRVLSTIAATPGASNRQAGLGAGIADQGQISKLLARLQRLGLIENAGAGAPKGAPNAWRLTPRGREVERALVSRA
jgi:AcrR family transcriptional regulator